MGTHYEIHESTERGEFRLVESVFDTTWAGVKNSGFRAREFPTRGGARNYIHKYRLQKRARVVRVTSIDGAPK